MRILEIDPKPLSTWGMTSITYLSDKKLKVSLFTEEKSSGALYLKDSRLVVRIKCLSGALLFPVYTGAYLVVQVTKGVFRVAFESVDSVKDLYRLGIKAKSIVLIGKYSAATIARTLLAVIKEVYYLVKSLLLLLGAELSFICGIIAPYQGRKMEAICEKQLQGGKSFLEDIRQKKSLKEISKTAFYFAYCFQPRWNRNEIEVSPGLKLATG